MTSSQIALVLAVFLVAGTVKGLVGMGLPTITIALTSLVLPLSDTIALIALPTIFIWLVLRFRMSAFHPLRTLNAVVILPP